MREADLEIGDLDVIVTYKVGLGGARVSDKVFEQLNEIAEKELNSMVWELIIQKH